MVIAKNLISLDSMCKKYQLPKCQIFDHIILSFIVHSFQNCTYYVISSTVCDMCCGKIQLLYDNYVVEAISFRTSSVPGQQKVHINA
jgi:hypothetical protein